MPDQRDRAQYRTNRTSALAFARSEAHTAAEKGGQFHQKSSSAASRLPGSTVCGSGAHFRVWANRANRVEVISLRENRPFPLKEEPQGFFWEWSKVCVPETATSIVLMAGRAFPTPRPGFNRKAHMDLRKSLTQPPTDGAQKKPNGADVQLKARYFTSCTSAPSLQPVLFDQQ